MMKSRSVSLCDLLQRLAGVLGKELVEQSRYRRISRAWISMSTA